MNQDPLSTQNQTIPLLVRANTMSVFWCPSQMDVRTNSQKNNYQTCNYNGNMGTRIGNGNDDCVCTGVATYNDMITQLWGCMNGNGVFYINSSIRFRDVSDGLSNTVFVAEVPDSGGDVTGPFNAGCDRRVVFATGASNDPVTEMSEYLIAAKGMTPSTAGPKKRLAAGIPAARTSPLAMGACGSCPRTCR